VLPVEPLTQGSGASSTLDPTRRMKPNGIVLCDV
jgi:hypothetical protein